MRIWIERIARSKMMWLALGVELLGILQLVQANMEELRVAIPPEYFGWVLLGVGIAIRILRVLTTQPISGK